MRVDLLLKTERTTLTIEANGDDKVRLNCQSWEDARVVRADEALQIVALGKTAYLARVERPAEYLNIDPTGMMEAGYGPATK
jgi:hypothetical protein